MYDGFAIKNISWKNLCVGIAGLLPILAGCSGNPSPLSQATLKGHTQGVNALVFSPDGQTLFTGGADMTVRVWDVANRKVNATWQSPSGQVTSLALAPGGQVLAIGTGYPSAGTIALRDVTNGKDVAKFENLAQVSTVAFSPDGMLLAAGMGSGKFSALMKPGQAVLWDVKSKSQRHTLEGHDGPVTSLAFTKDGKTLVTGGEDMKVKFWDVTTGKEQASTDFPGMARSLVFSPDGTKLALGGAAGKEGAGMVLFRGGIARVWEAATRQQCAEFKVQGDFVNGLVFAREGTVVATAGGSLSEGEVKLWDAATGNQLGGMKCHKGKVNCLALAPDGNTLATGSDDNTVMLWDLNKSLDKKR
jgi:WD40 repeat protein